MPASNLVLEHTWALYRDWQLAARSRKAAHSIWQRWALVTSMVGAMLGALTTLASGAGEEAPEVLSVLTAAVVGLGAYLGQQVIASTRERAWYRARGIAESLKSECMLFAAGAPPYDEEDPNGILSRATVEIVAKGKDVPASRASAEQRRADVPTGLPWTLEEYVKQRIQDQIDWYGDRSRAAAAKVRMCRGITIAIGLLGVVLAAVGQWILPALLGAFISLITALGAFVAAYLYAGRYVFLEASYTATANELDILLASWRASGKGEDDRQARAAFITRCEAILKAENGAWMAELGSGPKTDARVQPQALPDPE